MLPPLSCLMMVILFNMLLAKTVYSCCVKLDFYLSSVLVVLSEGSFFPLPFFTKCPTTVVVLIPKIKA